MRWHVTESDLEHYEFLSADSLSESLTDNQPLDGNDDFPEDISRFDEMEKRKPEAYSVKVRRAIEDYHERKRLREKLDTMDDEDF